MIFIVLIIIFFIWLFSTAGQDSFSSWKSKDEREIEEAGREGEEIADQDFKRYLNSDDYVINNVEIEVDGMRTELDKIVVNNDGVFLFEIKNYIGEIYGNEEDKEWDKYKKNRSGKEEHRTVRNPVKQLNRQIYILKKYFNKYRINPWINGYVYMVNGNSPYESDVFVNEPDEIDGIIHNGNSVLSDRQVDKIINLLEERK